MLAALDDSREEERRAALREEARDARHDRIMEALLVEMRAGTQLLREAVDVMRSLAARSPARRRSRSRSPVP